MIGVFIIAFGVQYVMIVSLEEESLQEIFDEEYTRYLQQVPRFIPHISGYPHASDFSFDIKAALRTDRRTFQSITAVTLLIALRWYLG